MIMFWLYFWIYVRHCENKNFDVGIKTKTDFSLWMLDVEIWQLKFGRSWNRLISIWLLHSKLKRESIWKSSKKWKRLCLWEGKKEVDLVLIARVVKVWDIKCWRGVICCAAFSCSLKLLLVIVLLYNFFFHLVFRRDFEQTYLKACVTILSMW